MRENTFFARHDGRTRRAHTTRAPVTGLHVFCTHD